MFVRSFLHKAPVTVPPEATAEEAARLMDLHGVGALLVVSGDELVGIVTDRDIATRCVGAGQAPTMHLSELLTPDPVTIQGSDDIFDAYRVLKDSGVRRLPVLEDEDVAGIVTADDLLLGLVLELAAVVSPVARELFHPDPAPARPTQ
jgi:CBS domain-containing protein